MSPPRRHFEKMGCNTHMLIPLTPELEALISALSSSLQVGKNRALRVIEQEKRSTFWDIGSTIIQHIIEHKKRSGYGSYLFTTLAQYLHMNKADLYRGVQFFERYPDGIETSPVLAWTTLKSLITIPNLKTRSLYIDKVVSEKLSSKDL